MQPFGPKISTLGTIYSAAQVQAKLTGTSAAERWLFYRLNKSGVFQNDLTGFVRLNSPQITHDTTKAVKRSLTLQLRGDATLDYLNDLIQPHYQLQMADGGWVDWSLGIFALYNPQKAIERSATWYSINGLDLGQFLVDNAFTDTFVARTGIDVTSWVLSVAAGNLLPALGPSANISGRYFFGPTGLSLSAPMSWEAGKTRLKALQDMFAAVAWGEPWYDENGALRSQPQQDFVSLSASPAFVFDTTNPNGNVVWSRFTEKIDYSKAYNQVLVHVEDARRTKFAVLYVNNNPASPISVQNWRPKTTVIRDSRIVTQQTAGTVANRLAQKYGRVYDEVILQTFAWPLSQNLDVYKVIWNTPDEGLRQDSFVEVKWTMKCGPGLATDHTLQRIVPV